VPHGGSRTSQGGRRPLWAPLEETWLTDSCPFAGSGTPPLRRPTPRPTSCLAVRPRHSYRASSGTCRSGSQDSPRASPRGRQGADGTQPQAVVRGRSSRSRCPSANRMTDPLRILRKGDTGEGTILLTPRRGFQASGLKTITRSLWRPTKMDDQHAASVLHRPVESAARTGRSTPVGKSLTMCASPGFCILMRLTSVSRRTRFAKGLRYMVSIDCVRYIP